MKKWFTIDDEDIIAVYLTEAERVAALQPNADGVVPPLVPFDTEKQLSAARKKKWAVRGVQEACFNDNFTGLPGFEKNKTVKRFKDTATGTNRIWNQCQAIGERAGNVVSIDSRVMAQIDQAEAFTAELGPVDVEIASLVAPVATMPAAGAQTAKDASTPPVAPKDKPPTKKALALAKRAERTKARNVKKLAAKALKDAKAANRKAARAAANPAKEPRAHGENKALSLVQAAGKTGMTDAALRKAMGWAGTTPLDIHKRLGVRGHATLRVNTIKNDAGERSYMVYDITDPSSRPANMPTTPVAARPPLPAPTNIDQVDTPPSPEVDQTVTVG